jgi:hypothetical protein
MMLDLAIGVVALASAGLIYLLFSTFLGYHGMLPNVWLLKRLNRYLYAVLLAVVMIGGAILHHSFQNQPLLPRLLRETFYLTAWLLLIEAVCYGFSALVRSFRTIDLYGSRSAITAWNMFGLRIMSGVASLDVKFYARVGLTFLLLTILWLTTGQRYLLFPMAFLLCHFVYVVARTTLPPIVLLCSPSGDAGASLFREVVNAARGARVVALIDGPLAIGGLATFLFDDFRSAFSGWENLLVALSQFACIVVVDGRSITPHLRYEGRRAISPLVIHKAIFVSSDDDECRLVASMVEEGILPDSKCVRMLHVGDLSNAIRTMTSSSRNLPRATVRLAIRANTQIAFIPNEPAPPWTGLGDIWWNSLAIGFEVAYQLSRSSSVRIDIVRPEGVIAYTMIHENQSPGRYSVSSDAKDTQGRRLAPGACRIVLTAGEERHVREWEIPVWNF